MRPMWSMGIAAVAIGALVAAFSVAAAPAKPQVPTWEYKVVSQAKLTEHFAMVPDGLNGLGAEGWELIAVGSRDGSDPPEGGYFYFKRPK